MAGDGERKVSIEYQVFTVDRYGQYNVLSLSKLAPAKVGSIPGEKRIFGSWRTEVFNGPDTDTGGTRRRNCQDGTRLGWQARKGTKHPVCQWTRNKGLFSRMAGPHPPRRTVWEGRSQSRQCLAHRLTTLFLWWNLAVDAGRWGKSCAPQTPKEATGNHVFC